MFGMGDGKVRAESEVFKELEAVCAQPGFIDVIAFLCLKDTYIHAVDGKLDTDVMAQQYDRSKLSRTELSTLIGLACKNGLVQKELSRESLEHTATLIYNLFEEIHSSFYLPIDFEKLLKSKVPPSEALSGGDFMREAIFYSGEGVYKHQYRDLSIIRYQNDNQWLDHNKGFLIDQAAVVIRTIEQLQLGNINKLISEAKSLYLPNYVPIFKFSIHEIVEYSKLPVDTVIAVINALSANPAEGMESFKSVDDFNHRNAFPIIKLDEDEYISFQPYSLWEALYESPFFWFNADKKYSATASKNRGAFTEDFTAQRLEMVFGKDNVYTNIDIFEGKNKTGEIDVLVTFGHIALVIQAKSKKLTISARKGNSNQLKDDFKKAVQDAYDQAYLCSELLLKEGVVFKYENGDVLKIDQTFKTIFPFCIVSDYYPALASQARQFLTYQVTDVIQFPYVMDVFLIDLLSEMLESPLFFIDYLQKRSDFADTLISHHELTILSVYIKQNLYFEDKPNMVLLDDDLSADLELAMLARRDGVDVPRAPEGILTVDPDTYVGAILEDIKHSSDYGLLQLGIHLLSISGDTKTQYNEVIAHLIKQCNADNKHHDVTFRFDEEKSGFTIHCNTDEVSTAYKRLAVHCEKRKYTWKANSWLGLCFCPITKKFKFATYHKSLWKQSDEMDRLVSDLPPIGDRNLIKNGELKLPKPKRVVSKSKKIGRNEPCPCGSDKKYKRCCL
jgi:hypothetical protein